MSDPVRHLESISISDSGIRAVLDCEHSQEISLSDIVIVLNQAITDLQALPCEAKQIPWPCFTEAPTVVLPDPGVPGDPDGEATVGEN